MLVTRTQRFRVKKHSPCWKQFDELSWQSKNLYNLANYMVKQEFIKTSKEQEQGLRDDVHWIQWYELCRICKDTEPYKALGSNLGQYTLKILSQNWKSFFKGIKDYSKHPEKYQGVPQMPQYLHKENGRFVVGLDSNKVKNINGYVYFCWKPMKYLNNHFRTIRTDRILTSRIIPRPPDYIFEVVYQIELHDNKKEVSRVAGLDIGVNNLITVATNCEVKPIVINGRPLKGMNAYYNKKKSDMQSALNLNTGRHSSNKLIKLTKKRNAKIDDYIHRASRKVVDWCVKNNIDTVVCGHNKGWKQESDMGKRNNQNFISIPHSQLIHKIAYKCEDVGIRFLEVEERYTSGTSFLDGEEPVNDNYDKSRRVARGLFVSNEGIMINADVNGAYQIIKKAFPNAFENGIQGVCLHPVIVNL